jgi:hypothetical protein
VAIICFRNLIRTQRADNGMRDIRITFLEYGIPTSGLQNFSGVYLPEGFVGKKFEIKLLTDVVRASRRNFRTYEEVMLRHNVDRL